MSDVTTNTAADTPAQQPAAPVQHPPLHWKHAILYMAASCMLALSQGLGQGFISANIPQIAGDLGITTTQASWLMAAYMIPRASLPLMLIKIRTQFGLRRFAEVGIIVYVVVAFIAIWIEDFRSAVVAQFLSGAAAAPLSTLAFLYMLEPLAPQWKMRLGLPLAMAMLLSGPSVARIVSPALIGDGGLTWVHLTVLGMAMVSLALVFALPLRPMPRMKVIQPLDFGIFLLIGFGFAGPTIGFVQGPIHYWMDAPWIGVLLAASVGALALAVAIELNRTAPLLDFRWLVSPAILHLTGTLFLFRLILSEQSTGAPRMFQVLGVAPSQLTVLFAVIVGATLLGALAVVGWIKPTRVPVYHIVALILIAIGALMDGNSTIDTRPEQLIVSQALIGFAGMLFLPPAMMAGLISALAKGPQYLLSFVIVFIATQSLGGVIGSGIFTTFINHQQAAHYQVLTEQLTAASAQTTRAIAQQIVLYSGQITDGATLKAQAVSQIAQTASSQAYVMAYNDAYRLIAAIAIFALVALLLHLLRDFLAARMTPAQPTTPDVTS